jgi:hypothetical protein
VSWRDYAAIVATLIVYLGLGGVAMHLLGYDWRGILNGYWSGIVGLGVGLFMGSIMRRFRR